MITSIINKIQCHIIKISLPHEFSFQRSFIQDQPKTLIMSQNRIPTFLDPDMANSCCI